MQTGLLNKLGRYLWNPEPRSQRNITVKSWDDLLAHAEKAMGQRKHDPAVDYNDFKRLDELAMGTAWACIDLRASAVASKAELKLYYIKNGVSPEYSKLHELTPKKLKQLKKDEYVQKLLIRKQAVGSEIVEITEHPMLDLLASVNDKLTSHNLYYLLEDNLLTFGNCFWKLELDSDHVPGYIWLPDVINYKSMDQTLKGKVNSYTFREGSKDTVYPGDEIIHFHFPTHKDNKIGKAPMVEAAPHAQIEKNYLIYTNSIFVNMGRNGGLIRLGGNLTDKQVESYQKQWDEKMHRGPSEANKSMVVRADDFEFSPFGMSAKDMSLDEIWRNNREAIANKFHIPLSILTMESSNRAVALQGSIDFWMYAGWPDLKMIGEELSESLCPFYEDNLFCLFENPIPVDQTVRNREIQTNLSVGKTTRNEERDHDNEEPIEGGDELLVPNNLVPISQVGVTQQQQMAMLAEEIIRRMRERNDDDNRS